MTALMKIADVPGIDSGPPFLAFVSDAKTGAAVREAAKSVGHADNTVIDGDLDATVRTLSEMVTPDLLLVDIGGGETIMSDVEDLSAVCDAHTRVILIGAVNDLKLYRDLIAAGVTDYLVKPVTAEEVAAAVQQAASFDEDEQISKSGPELQRDTDVVAVIGVRGGVGASTIAANAAWFASEHLDRNVTLIDMDLTFGTQAITFDVDPGAGLSEAMLEPERMDELFIKRALIPLGDRFKLMAAESDTSRGDIASAQAFKGILQYVRADADLIVVDLPRTLVVSQLKLLEEFRRVVLVAEPNLASMRDCARLKTLAETVNPDAQVSAVVNRQGLAQKQELTLAMFEEGIGFKTAARLPFDPKTALQADAAGKCLVQSGAKSKLGKSMTAVAHLIAGRQETPAASKLSGLLRLGRKGLKRGEA